MLAVGMKGCVGVSMRLAGAWVGASTSVAAEADARAVDESVWVGKIVAGVSVGLPRRLHANKNNPAKVKRRSRRAGLEPVLTMIIAGLRLYNLRR